MLIYCRNYDEDFEDDDNESDDLANKKLADSSTSSAQRLGSGFNHKIDTLADELKRWKD